MSITGELERSRHAEPTAATAEAVRVGAGAWGRLTRQAEVDLGELRIAGAGLLTAGALLPLLNHPGVACALRSLTGIPCPLCGMSTSVQATMRLDFSTALATNPVGILAVLVAVSLLAHRRGSSLRVPVWTVHLGLTLMWLWELVRFSVI
jgi:Protein of unknown function (DUF2752)